MKNEFQKSLELLDVLDSIQIYAGMGSYETEETNIICLKENCSCTFNTAGCTKNSNCQTIDKTCLPNGTCGTQTSLCFVKGTC